MDVRGRHAAASNLAAYLQICTRRRCCTGKSSDNTHLAPVLPLPANVSPAAGQAHAMVNGDQAVPLHQNVASIAVCRQQKADEEPWRKQ